MQEVEKFERKNHNMYNILSRENKNIFNKIKIFNKTKHVNNM